MLLRKSYFNETMQTIIRICAVIFSMFLLSSCIPLNVINLSCKTEPEFLSTFEQEIFEEVNLVRQNPQRYAKFIEQQFLTRKNRLTEGYSVVEETVMFLQNASSVNPLKLVGCLCVSAKDHAQDTGPTGVVGHTGTNGSTPVTRTMRHASGIFGGGGENISYGVLTPREVVIQLLVDDGVPSRGHRLNIMNASYKSIGVAQGAHAQYQQMCVMLFSMQTFDNVKPVKVK
jgi:uncharacterized protein YkwD